MKKEILVATHNKGKIKEFKRILEPLGFSVNPVEDEKLLESIVEDGKTFEENALIKARTVFEKYKVPTLADDSGLCVDCLNGAPGIYSARYLGEDTPFDIKRASLIKEVNEKNTNRNAHFYCAIALISNKGEFTFSGKCEGQIGTEIKGTNGFGYDPIFYINGKSFAELEDYEKDKLSHRGKALENLEKNIEGKI